MNNRITILILSMIALFSVVYGIYRSLPEIITTVENGNEVVYGQPQHGLILGLFILAAVCVNGIIKRLVKPVENQREVTITPQTAPPVTSTSASYRPLS